VRAFACMVLAVISVNPGDRLRWTQNFPDSCSVQGSFGEMICVNPFSSLPFSPRWQRLPFPRRPMSLQMRPVVDQLINVPVDDGPWVKAKISSVKRSTSGTQSSRSPRWRSTADTARFDEPIEPMTLGNMRELVVRRPSCGRERNDL
jgi:hypothetical protein